MSAHVFERVTYSAHLLVDSHAGRRTEDLANGVMCCSRQRSRWLELKNSTTGAELSWTPKNVVGPKKLPVQPHLISRPAAARAVFLSTLD